MKKLLLTIALVLLCGVTMAQTTNTVKFTFARTGTGLTDIPVNVTVNGVATDDITATLSASATNVTKLMGLSDNGIVCFANEGTGNSSAATETAPHIYTLTINGLDGETLKNISIANKALTGGGAFQGTSVNRQRHYNVSSGTSTENLTLVEDRIDLISVTGTNGDVERAKDFAVDNVGIGTTLVIQLKMYNANDITGEEAKGCFYGLTGFTLTTEVPEVETPEEPETPVEHPTAFTFSQVTASDLMAKTEPTYIVIKNLSRTNNNWFTGAVSSAEITESTIFIWEPNGEGKFRLKKLDGTYMKFGGNDTSISFSTKENAALFTANCPAGSFNGDADSNPYITDRNDANMVRFVNGNNVWINVQSATGTPKYNTGQGGWTIHYVYEATATDAYTVNISDAGFATFFAHAAVTIPENVNAYYITAEGINDNSVTLTQIEDVIPANTAVILEGEGEYAFNVSETGADAVSGNLLKGTAVNTNITEEAYVLGNKGGVGLYKALTTNVSTSGGEMKVFLNNAGKAYLPASAVPATANGAASFSFRYGEGTTGIDEMTEQRAESKEIYDLIGRKVEAITAPGIYIVNGVKRVVR